MKFFTTEWYNDTIVSEMYSQLRKTQNAAQFSEKFYNKLFEIEKKAFLRYSKRIAKFERAPFNAAVAEAQFIANYNENLAFIKANVPEDILADVKDIRVLALGSAEYEIAARITRFCGQTERKCRAADQNYEDELQNVANVTGWEVINSLDLLIGSPIESVIEDGGYVTITTSKELVGVSYKVTLEGAIARNLPENTVGSIINQHELALNDDSSLSFGLLCLDDDSSPLTVEFAAKSVNICKA